MKDRQINSTDYSIHFLLVQSSDGKTPAVGLNPIVNLCKSGGTFYLASGTISEKGFGWYSLAGNSYDRDTLGELLIHCSGTGADVSDDRYFIVPWNPFEKNLGLVALSGINQPLPQSGDIYAACEVTWQNSQAELSSVPQMPTSRSQMLLWNFERSHNLTKTTGSGDYVYKTDGVTVLGSGQLFDDGTTFTRQRYV